MYASDNFLVSPMLLCMKRILLICNSYADEYVIIYNGSKYKFLVCIFGKLCNQGRRHGFENGGQNICEQNEQTNFRLTLPILA